MPATAKPKFAGISCTPSLARAAHLGVVQLKYVGLLEAVFSICSATVPVIYIDYVEILNTAD